MAEWDATAAARLLRSRAAAVLTAWGRDVVADVPELGTLSDFELREHVQEIVERLADWMNGYLDRYIVDQIAREHGARVELASVGDETVVTVHWPRSAHVAPPRVSGA